MLNHVGGAKRVRLRDHALLALMVVLSPPVTAHAQVTPADAATTVARVTVTAPPPSDGSTSESGGLVVPDRSFGPLGSIDSLDTPFTTTSIPQILIRDQQATSLEEAARNDPSFGVYAAANTSGYTNFFIRGFSVGSAPNNRIDGLPVTTQSGILLQDYERIDILKGASGLLYGFTSPGGLINYVSKLPRADAYTELSASYESDSHAEGALDASRRFGPGGQFGVRLNLAGGGGDLAVAHTGIDDYLGALALDWRPRAGTRFWVNTSYSRDAYDGLQPGFVINALQVPRPPSNDTFLGLPFARHVGVTSGLEGGFESELLPWLSARGAFGSFLGRRDNRYAGATLLDAAGDYTLASNPHNHWALRDNSGEVVLTPRFQWGAITSKTDIGVTANEEHISEHNLQPNLILPGVSNLYTPAAFADPNQPIVTDPAPINSVQNYRNYLVLETLGLGPYVDLLGGVSYATIRYSNRAATHYAEDATTGSAAVIFKPLKGLSIYGSYIQGLDLGPQAGQTFGTAPVVNALAYLPPFISTQYEAGVKWRPSAALETNLAFFHVERPSSVYTPTTSAATAYVFANDGEQVNEGVELNATGRIYRNLTVVAGVTLLDPEITGSQGGLLNGKDAIGIPRVAASLFGEYALDAIPGLTLLGGVHYTGEVYTDAANVRRVPDYGTFDVGAKYETTVASKPVTARLYVQNVTGQDYWIGSIFTSRLSLGSPRSLRLDLSTRF